jgi:hypothetical protein
MAKIPSIVFILIGLVVAVLSYILGFFVFIWIGVIILAFGVIKLIIGLIGKPSTNEPPPAQVVNLTNMQNNPYDNEVAQVTPPVLKQRGLHIAKNIKKPKK